MYRVCGLLFLVFLYWFFSGTGVWTQDLTLARQVAYHLSQCLESYLCSVNFSARVLCFCLVLSWLLFSYICLLCSWDDKLAPQCLAYCLRWVMQTFLPRLALNHSTPHLSLPNGNTKFLKYKIFYFFPKNNYVAYLLPIHKYVLSK
jgi:hypothetical protein